MPLRFTKQFISAETFEAVAVFDVDGDGIPDIVTGGFWYAGPDFRRKHLISDGLRRYRDYYDEFSVIPMDIDGDGRIDFVTGGWWGESLRWKRNPGPPAKGDWACWEERPIATGTGNVETTRAWDIDGDGEAEIVANTPNHPLCAYKLVRDRSGRATGEFRKHVLFGAGLGHGLGFGDVDSDGRCAFVTPKGILRPPPNGPLSGQWTLSEELLVDRDASIPVLVVDVDQDGRNELIVGNSHSYGLSWWKREAGGWVKRPIDPHCSQYHDLHWADIDGDGACELITGKRYLAHCGSDPGEYDDLGVYYFKWNGAGFTKHPISFGPPGEGAGCGIQFALADLRGSGRLDVVAPGKDGLHVLWNLGA